MVVEDEMWKETQRQDGYKGKRVQLKRKFDI
jgi:hypothetical protein